jgi:hypothetical protein
VLGEELLVLDDQFLELLDLVAFETPVPGHDFILARFASLVVQPPSSPQGALMRDDFAYT